MADTREILITIQQNTEQDNTDASSSTDSSKVTSQEKGSVAKAAFAKMAVDAAKQTVDLIISDADFKLDRYMNLSDDYIGQRNMAIAQHYISSSVSMASSVFNAGLVGFMAAGPIGAIVNASLTTIFNVAQNAQAYSHALEQQNIALKQMDLQLAFTRNRAGWSTHAASIGEDL